MTFYVFVVFFLFSQASASGGTKVQHIDEEFTLRALSLLTLLTVYLGKVPSALQATKTQ